MPKTRPDLVRNIPPGTSHPQADSLAMLDRSSLVLAGRHMLLLVTLAPEKVSNIFYYVFYYANSQTCRKVEQIPPQILVYFPLRFSSC